MDQKKHLTPLIIIISVLIATLASSCGNRWQIRGQRIISYVNKQPVTYAQFDSAAKDQRMISTTPERDLEKKRDVLNELIDSMLVRQQIDSTYEDLKVNPNFRGKLDDYLEKPVLKLLYQKEISDKIEVSDEEAEQLYEENLSRYTTPEQVRARHILIKADVDTFQTHNGGLEYEIKKGETVSSIAGKFDVGWRKLWNAEDPRGRKNSERFGGDPGKIDIGDKIWVPEEFIVNSSLVQNSKKEARAEAERIRKRILAGEEFAVLAEQHSEDPGSARRGGDLGFFGRGRMVKPFEDAVFSMKDGEISDVVESEFGYHIIKREEYKPEEVKPLDETLMQQIKSSEKSKREHERVEWYVDSLKQAADYKYNDELLANDEDTTWTGEDWVLIVNGIDTIYYDRYLDQKPKYMRYKQIDEMTRADQEEMLGTLSVNYLLLQIARDRDYFSDSLVVTQGDQFIKTQARNRIEDKMKAKDYEPDDSTCRAYFEDNISEFVVEKPLHVFHIIFTDSVLAAAVYDSIQNGADFVEMARRYYPGEPEIREVAYDLDFISEQEMPEEFWKAANTLSIGSVSPPVRTEWGWHIIKLVAKKKSKTYEQVKARIKTRLRKQVDEEARAKYVESIRQNAKIKVNEPLLAEYQIGSAADLPTYEAAQ